MPSLPLKRAKTGVIPRPAIQLQGGLGIWLAGMAVLAIAIGFVHLESKPPLWWDEGWTLTVARHWVERGHYGHYLSGVPAARGLEAAFPVVASVAGSFKLFGVGVWQGRLPGVLFSLASLGILCWLSWRLYRPAVATGTLFVLLFLTGHPQINPLLNGRQVLADVPVAFFLLAGAACLYKAWNHPLVFLPMASIFWGLALMTKAQALPFWLFSLFVPLLAALLVKSWRTAALLLASGLGAWLALTLFGRIQEFTLRGHTIPGEPVEGLVPLVAVVPDIGLRVYALEIVLIFALPLACGIMWAGFRFFQDQEWRSIHQREPAIRLLLLSLAGGWFAWFALLSNGGERYLASPALLGSMFTASMLYDWSSGYDVHTTLRKASSIFQVRRAGWQAIGALLVILLVGYSLAVTFFTYAATWRSGDESVNQIAGYLNSQTPADALVESYDSELFFFLQRPYHFPPDALHGELLRRYLLDQDTPVPYDPMASDPDYLVVGPTGDRWNLYDTVLLQGAFRQLLVKGAYVLYERQHP